MIQKLTQQQCFEAHRMVYEALFPAYRLSPFIFPFTTQSAALLSKYAKQQERNSFRRWRDNYTLEKT